MTLKRKLERIQRLAARFICSTYRRKESVTLMLQRCNLDLLEVRRKKFRLKVLYQIMQDQLKIDKLKYLHAPGKRNPRTNHDYVIKPFQTNSDTFRYSFFPDAIEMWNQLPNAIVSLKDVTDFENAAEAYLRELTI